MRLHTLATAVVALLGWLGGIEAWAWAVLALAVGLVLTAELLNTALETLGDRVAPGQDPLVGRAKDVAAGAVLVAAGCAVAVGVAVFLPRLDVLLAAAVRWPFLPMAVLASLAASAWLEWTDGRIGRRSR
ncbi:MAG: diacylglycerol kinase [Clostridia bacterium]|nr:diacylglycerol kinase [Clostridia bacterium]